MEDKKRLEIQTILKDDTLDAEEKNLKIQQLMDGRSGHVTTEPVRTDCDHYVSQCAIVAPCCNVIYGCRLCHDETSRHGNMNRFAIVEIVCKKCDTRQAKSNNCISCGVIFAEYYCGKCNVWMTPEQKKPFHCDKCGICRVGGQENFVHCDVCCMCINRDSYKGHKCRVEKYKNNCPVCREDMFTSRQAPMELPCGHAIHSQCYRVLTQHDYRCPMCQKSLAPPTHMEEIWSNRATDISQQPMPEDLRRSVNIFCIDCNTKTSECSWHFLGVQCPSCKSFNTVPITM